MAGYGAKEARINRERRPVVNTCGECGIEIDETATLCNPCERGEATKWEPVSEEGQ